MFTHIILKVDNFFGVDLLLLTAMTTSILLCCSFSFMGLSNEIHVSPYMYQGLYCRQGTQNIMNLEAYQKEQLCPIPS